MPLKPHELLWMLSLAGTVSGGFFLLLWQYGYRKPVRRTCNALNGLNAQLGFTPLAKAGVRVKYLHEYPSGNPRPRFAAGTFEGLYVEVRFDPVLRSNSRGRTMVGVHCAKPLGIEAGLSHRDAASVIVNSLFSRPNYLGSPPLFGRYDGWGPEPDVRRVFTSEMQSRILAFPRTFTLLMLSGDDAVALWPGVEEDPGVVRQAMSLVSLLVSAAR